MEKLQRYPIRIDYKPGTKIKFVDDLSRLYICRSISANGFNPDWPLIAIQNKDKWFPDNTTDTSQEIVIKHEDKFVNLFLTLHRKISKKTIPPPTSLSHSNLTPSWATTETLATSKPET